MGAGEDRGTFSKIKFQIAESEKTKRQFQYDKSDIYHILNWYSPIAFFVLK